MKSLTTLSTLILLMCATVASAHPGPPGHSHGDDWPFGLAITAIVLSLTAYYLKKKHFR